MLGPKEAFSRRSRPRCASRHSSRHSATSPRERLWRLRSAAGREPRQRHVPERNRYELRKTKGVGDTEFSTADGLRSRKSLLFWWPASGWPGFARRSREDALPPSAPDAPPLLRRRSQDRSGSRREHDIHALRRLLPPDTASKQGANAFLDANEAVVAGRRLGAEAVPQAASCTASRCGVAHPCLSIASQLDTAQ